jgi:bla regulator protein blaR1
MARLGPAAILLAALAAFGQDAPKRLEFEVASIKPADPNTRGSHLRLEAGERFTAQNVNLRQLITTAYEIQDFQLTGGPDWIDTQRWDIVANPETSSALAGDPRQLNSDQSKTVQSRTVTRLAALLADRFKLTVRREMREQSVYFLTIAKNGAKLQPAKDQTGGGGSNTNMNNGRGHAVFTSANLDLIAEQLARRTGRPVLDKTGLTGKYDLTLDWTTDDNTTDSTAPTIFTALQEQLGLRLDSQNAPVPVWIVEHAERPSEN